MAFIIIEISVNPRFLSNLSTISTKYDNIILIKEIFNAVKNRKILKGDVLTIDTKNAPEIFEYMRMKAMKIAPKGILLR